MPQKADLPAPPPPVQMPEVGTVNNYTCPIPELERLVSGKFCVFWGFSANSTERLKTLQKTIAICLHSEYNQCTRIVMKMLR